MKSYEVFGILYLNDDGSSYVNLFTTKELRDEFLVEDCNYRYFEYTIDNPIDHDLYCFA